MAVSYRGDAFRDSIIQQAAAIAAQQGITPNQALWNYIQTQGISPGDADVMLGTGGMITSYASSRNTTPTTWQPSAPSPAPAPAYTAPPAPAWQPSAATTNPAPAPAPAASQVPVPSAALSAEENLINRWYRNVANRTPTASEMSSWKTAIQNVGQDAAEDQFVGQWSAGSRSPMPTASSMAPRPTPTPSPTPSPAPAQPATGMMTGAQSVQPLDAATKASIIQQAQAIAAQQGISPERALYNYTQSQGLSPAQVDTYMGYPAGTTQNWAVSNGQAAAPQGNYNPAGAPAPVPAPTPTPAPAPAPAANTGMMTGQPPATAPLDAATKASIIQQAQAIATQQGISPERALMNYAQQNNISSAQIDTMMGYPSGTTQNWASQNLNAASSSGTRPPPPTFNDVLGPYNKWSQDTYGTIIERPWASDADSRAAKTRLDGLYKAQVEAYNQTYGTNIQPDPAVLGETAQPNDYSKHRNSSGGLIADTVSHWGRVVANNPAIMAAITAGAAAFGVPPAATAAVLGANRAGQDGNLQAGLETGLLSFAGGTAVNNLTPTFGYSGATAGAGTAAGTAAGGAAAAGAAGTAAGGTGLTAAGASLPTAAGMGGGTGLTTAGATLPGAAGMGGGTGLLAGGTAAGAVGAAGAATAIPSVVNAANNVLDTNKLLTGAANLTGAYLNQQAATDAARTQADAQIRAAQIAADAAKFKPVGVTTSFGSSNFGYDDKGNLTSAGYTLAPGVKDQQLRLAAASGGLLNQFTGVQAATAGMQQTAGSAMALGQNQLNVGQNTLNAAQQWNPNIDQVRAQTAGMQTGANSSMNLGNQYLATSPQAQAAKYMADQQGLLAPGRAAEMAALQSQMQAQGRGGFAIGGGVNGQMASNPQMQALYNARMQQDAQLAAQSTQGGMDYAKFGAGMVGTGGDLLKNMYGTQSAAYDPYKTAIGIGQGQANFGIGAVGAGGDLLSSMYGTQTAAYNPYNAALGGMQTLEGLGQNALDQGIRLGSATTAANSNAGQLLASGMTGAANTIGNQAQQAGSMWGNLLQGGANTFERYNQPQGTNYDPTKYRLTPL